jgi:hypothetical protein
MRIQETHKIAESCLNPNHTATCSIIKQTSTTTTAATRTAQQ